MDLISSFTQMPVGQMLLTLFLALLVYVCVKNYLLLQFFKKHGIPGPKPTLFFGHLFALRANGRMPHETISSWTKEYGNVFGMFFGPQPALVINNADILKDIMIRHFNNFVDRTRFNITMPPVSDSILLAMGDRWRTARRLLTPAFSGSKLKVLSKAMNEQTDVLVEVLGKSDRKEINVVEVCQALTLDVIGECALALNVNCQRNSRDEFLVSVRNFIKTSGNQVIRVAVGLPGVGHLLVMLNRFMPAGKLTAMIVDNLEEVIAIRRKDGTKRRTDLLQLLLDATEDNPLHENDTSTNLTPSGQVARKTLTDKEIIGNTFVFLMAGYETTATTLGFAFYLLAIHPDIQEKLYESIMVKLKDVSNPSYEEVFELAYLDQILNETLRLYPPVPHFLLRKAEKDITIGDVFIPKGVVVQAPVWQLHRDPENWPKPEMFDPERFSAENKANIKTGAFLPFGIGPRNCIGFRFAQLEMKLAVIKVLKSFKIVPSSRTEIPVQLACPSILLSAKNGIHLKLLPRN